MIETTFHFILVPFAIFHKPVDVEHKTRRHTMFEKLVEERFAIEFLHGVSAKVEISFHLLTLQPSNGVSVYSSWSEIE